MQFWLMGFDQPYLSNLLASFETLKFHVMHESLNLWLNMSFLSSLLCISDIQYIKIVSRIFVEKY